MPTYEYVCKACGEHLEVVQSFADPALSTCASCGGGLRKVFGNVGIVFKGSGFYKTDSRAASSGTGSKGHDGGSKAPGDGGTATKEPATASTTSSGSSNGSSSSATSGASATSAPAAAS